MAINRFYDAVKETTAVVGTGAMTLLGAKTGYRPFSMVLSDGQQCCYRVEDQNAAGPYWEVGIGTYTAATNSLSRDTILASSNATAGGTAATFIAGAKDVSLVVPAAKMFRTLFDHTADGSSTSTNGTEDTLYTDTLEAGVLGYDGDKIEATYGVILVASATATRRVQVYFGGTVVLDTGTLTFASAGTADIWVVVIRESSTVVRVKAEFVPSGITLQPTVTYTRITGLTLSNTQIMKITGIATSTGATMLDIVAKLGTAEFKPAA